MPKSGDRTNRSVLRSWASFGIRIPDFGFRSRDFCLRFFGEPPDLLARFADTIWEFFLGAGLDLVERFHRGCRRAGRREAALPKCARQNEEC